MNDDITQKIQEMNKKLAAKYQDTHQIDTKTEELVNELYIALCAIFRGCWITKTQLEIDAYKKQLFLSLKQFDVSTQEQIEMGLRNARASDTTKFPSTKTVVDWCLNNTNNETSYTVKSTFDHAGLIAWQGLSEQEKQQKKELGKKSLRGILDLLKKG